MTKKNGEQDWLKAYRMLKEYEKKQDADPEVQKARKDSWFRLQESWCSCGMPDGTCYRNLHGCDYTPPK